MAEEETTSHSSDEVTASSNTTGSAVTVDEFSVSSWESATSRQSTYAEENRNSNYNLAVDTDPLLPDESASQNIEVPESQSSLSTNPLIGVTGNLERQPSMPSLTPVLRQAPLSFVSQLPSASQDVAVRSMARQTPDTHGTAITQPSTRRFSSTTDFASSFTSASSLTSQATVIQNQKEFRVSKGREFSMYKKSNGNGRNN